MNAACTPGSRPWGKRGGKRGTGAKEGQTPGQKRAKERQKRDIHDRFLSRGRGGGRPLVCGWNRGVVWVRCCVPEAKAALGPDAPRMGSIAYNSSEARTVPRPPSYGRRLAVPRGRGRFPSRSEALVLCRFSVGLTRRVLATRHPFAETAVGPVRCLRLGEPPRPKQTTGASGKASLAQSQFGGIRRQENRMDFMPGPQRVLRTCRRPTGRPPVCAPPAGWPDCGCTRVRARLGARRPSGGVCMAPAWRLR